MTEQETSRPVGSTDQEAGKPFEGWAIVEVMGHRRLAGYVTEEIRFGVPMLRVDVPRSEPGTEPVTQFYPGTALFSVTPCTAEVVLRMRQRATVEKPYQLTSGTAWDPDY